MSKQNELVQFSRGASGGGSKNLVINGAFSVAQRNSSASSLSSGDAYSTVDRFMRRISSAGTWTQSQSTDVPSGQGFGYSLKMDCTTANSSLSATSDLQIQYRCEGQDIQRLSYGNASAKKMTLSFWVKATKTGTNIVQFYQDDGNDHISKSYTVNTSNTWEYKTITFEGNTAASINNDNSRGLIMQFHLAAGSNKTSGTLATSWASYTEANEAVGQVNNADSTSNNWLITGVQLEVNDNATDFEHRSFGDELARCQRYFIRLIESGGSTYYWGHPITTSNEIWRRLSLTLPNQMRAAPTASNLAIAGNGTTGTPSLELATTLNAVFILDNASATDVWYSYLTQCDLSSEL